MHTLQEKRQREETDPELQKFLKMFSVRDAVLEPGISKSFEQLVPHYQPRSHSNNYPWQVAS